MMNTFPIDQARLGTLALLSVSPKANYDNPDEQATNREGVPQWTAQVLVQPEPRADYTPKPEIMQVTVSMIEAPHDIDPMTQVSLTGLTARQWSNNGRSGVSFSADGIEAEDRKSVV